MEGVGLVLEQSEPADGEEHHADADGERAGDPEGDDPAERLERLGGLLLEVGDDELPQLRHRRGDGRGRFVVVRLGDSAINAALCPAGVLDGVARGLAHPVIQHAASALRQALAGIGANGPGTSAPASVTAGYAAMSVAIASRSA